MKKQTIIAVIIGIVLISIFLFVKPFLTGEVVSSDNGEKIKLGYCPTMYEEALKMAEENNYKLREFGSASATLASLKNKQIDNALIGRKANQHEINSDINEKVIDSGYTLVSNKKEFIDYSELSELEIYTYLSKDITKELIPENSNISYLEKDEVSEKINQGERALISWKDWEDGFELFVVTEENKKVEDFRGVFLYEN